jgi:outer membrane biosynthesis protein TonB
MKRLNLAVSICIICFAGCSPDRGVYDNARQVEDVKPLATHQVSQSEGKQTDSSTQSDVAVPHQASQPEGKVRPPRNRVSMWPTEAQLREFIIESVMPTYPDNSKVNKTSGTVVADVFTDEEGNVIYVDVVQSPDEYIRDATITALYQWKFEQLVVDTVGMIFPMTGQITFLYILDGDNAEVTLAPFPTKEKVFRLP